MRDCQKETGGEAMTDDIRHRLNDQHDAVTLAIPPLEFIFWACYSDDEVTP